MAPLGLLTEITFDAGYWAHLEATCQANAHWRPRGVVAMVRQSITMGTYGYVPRGTCPPIYRRTETGERVPVGK